MKQQMETTTDQLKEEEQQQNHKALIQCQTWLLMIISFIMIIVSIQWIYKHPEYSLLTYPATSQVSFLPDIYICLCLNFSSFLVMVVVLHETYRFFSGKLTEKQEVKSNCYLKELILFIGMMVCLSNNEKLIQSIASVFLIILYFDAISIYIPAQLGIKFKKFATISLYFLFLLIVSGLDFTHVQLKQSKSKQFLNNGSLHQDFQALNHSHSINNEIIIGNQQQESHTQIMISLQTDINNEEDNKDEDQRSLKQ